MILLCWNVRIYQVIQNRSLVVARAMRVVGLASKQGKACTSSILDELIQPLLDDARCMSPSSFLAVEPLDPVMICLFQSSSCQVARHAQDGSIRYIPLPCLA